MGLNEWIREREQRRQARFPGQSSHIGTAANDPQPGPAGWYGDPSGEFAWRYWDGAAWTSHVSAAPGQVVSADLKPGLVAVWITAALSLLTVAVGTGDSASVGVTLGVGSTVTGPAVGIPLGLFFTWMCWRLVGRARANALERGVQVPGGYTAARVVSLVLGGLSLLNSIAISVMD
jgi:hypothetical protein